MTSGYFVTNRVANPVLRRLLRTRLGRRLGRRLLVIRYRGRRTGRRREVVVQYARSGPTVWILVGQAERKAWWQNLRAPGDVDLWLQGQRTHGRAVAVVGSVQPAEARRGLVAYLSRVPQAVPAVGLRSMTDARAVADTARRVVLVRVDLHVDPDEAA
jgi:F420H(2)-dependent quinone reductase